MLTYAGDQYPTFSFDPKTVRAALRLIEMQGIEAAAKRTPIPEGILLGYKKTIKGTPPSTPGSMPYDERPHAAQSRPTSKGRSFKTRNQTAYMIR